MQKSIVTTHPANVLLGTLLLGRDYCARVWHHVFGPLITDCVEHARALRGALNQAAADTVEIDQAIDAATKDDGVIDQSEAKGIRALLAKMNRRLCEGPAAN